MRSFLVFGLCAVGFVPSALASICPKTPAATTKAVSLDAELNQLAGRPEFASRADALLSQLISKQSPLVNRWMEREQLYSASEEAVVRKWRRYFLETQLSEYPPPEAALKGPVDEFLKQVANKHFPKTLKKNWEGVFVAARQAALAEVDSWHWGPGSEKQRAELRSRIEGIRLFWLDQISEGAKKSPLEFVAWSVAYDPVPNVINVGLEALGYPSEDVLFAVFAHEIGHASDPCRWGAFFSGAHPQNEVLACLRTDASVGAKPRDDAPLKELVAKRAISPELAKALQLNPTCNKAEYPPSGVQADQILEAYADWFAAEVLVRTKRKPKNPRPDLCVAKELRAGSSYPDNRDRLNRIYLAHPALRNQIGKGGASSPNKTPRYCEPKRSLEKS